jgi:gliding motility-associated-like protein
VFTSTAVNSPTVATYTLTITDNLNLCKSTQTLTIYQDIKPPIASIAPTGTPVITCNTPTISLTNNSSSAPSIFFHPLAAVGFSWAGPPPQQPVQLNTNYTASTPGTYTLIVKDLNNGCIAPAYKTIIDNRVYPIVNTPNPPPPFVRDCAAPGATIYPILSGTTTGFTYSWVAVPTASFSSYTSSVTIVTGIGPYKIIVTNPANGCQAFGVVDVVNGSINADFNASEYTGFAPLSVNFTNLSSSSSTTTGTSSITSVWSFGNGISQITTSASISPSTTYTNAGTYTVTMYVSKGTCLDTVSKVITVEMPSKLDVPNVFTPNGDGSNDVFFLKVANLTDISANIFDRWGNKVYESTSSTGNIAWDGTGMSGKDLPAGTYFYIIKATGKDGMAYEKKGNVSIYR